MVVHLSSKLSHLAQSFRPQHHLNSLRNAFPSASGGHAAPGFFDPTNVFQHANSAVGSAGQAAAGSGAAGSSAGAGAGGAKYHAGRGAHNWGFQTQQRLVTQAQAGADGTGRTNDDEKDETSSSRRPRLLNARHAPSQRFATQPRRKSISSDRPLLTREEAGLSSTVRLSSSEMQERYRSAFLQGEKTAEVQEMERQVDAVDLGPSATTSSTGRRASVSSPSLPAVHPATLTRTHSSIGLAPAARALHTSAQPVRTSFAAPPPRADVPRVRRNSTSAATTSSESISAGEVIEERRPRPPVRSKSGRQPPVTQRPRFSSPAAQYRYDAILAARETGKHEAVQAAVLRYLAVPDEFSTVTHNTAMESLRATRTPNMAIRQIVELYSDLFNHDNLKPNRLSYEIILRTLCQRDLEITRDMRFIERRAKKKRLAALARGPFNDVAAGSAAHQALTDVESRALEHLAKEDYLGPAIEIFKSIGRTGDALSAPVVGQLLKAAVNRKRVDLALSIFARLEQTNAIVPSFVYLSLLEMYGNEGDADSVMRIFEAFLQARANGLPESKPDPNFQRRHLRTVPTKHKHSAVPEWVVMEEIDSYWSRGDGGVWRQAIKALLAAGDSAQAVTVFQRMLDAIEGEGERKPGYPTELQPDVIATIVAGFVKAGDFASATTWFDNGLQRASSGAGGTALKDLQHLAYFSVPLYTAIDDLASSTFVNHVYRSLLAQAGRKFKLIISDFVSVIDHNLAVSYQSASEAERQASLDAIAEFQGAFQKATRADYVDNVGRDFELSTGVLSRIAQAFGAAGRFDQAARFYKTFAFSVERSIDRANRLAESNTEKASKGVERTAAKWALIASTESLYGSLGMLPAATAGEFEYRSETRPPVREAAIIVMALNRVRGAVDWDLLQPAETALVDSYLRDKAAANGDVHALGLTGELWYTVIEAFASVSAVVRRGFVPAFDFPGFEPIIDDFVASGASIPAGKSFNYAQLVKALRQGGMSRERTVAVLSVLDQLLAETIELSPTASSTDPSAAADATPEATAQTEQQQSPAVEAESSTESQEAETSATFPTPPSTPPTYFAELSPAPQAPSSVTSIDFSLSQQIDGLVHSSQFKRALELVRSSAAAGRYAHPDALARLLEAFGREGQVDVVRELYALAYSTLPVLASDPIIQSVAWVSLEDHMIIALAQAGQLDEVGHHRDRLLQAGSAPSADGYAAMILNMKETTDNAAVALTLFEESQRFNVKPNVYLFNTLISKLSRARRAKEALEYFELMKQYGLQPSSITYGAIINACCKTGDDASADYLFQEMVSSPGFRPRVPPYNTMIQFYTSTKPNRERALHYYTQLLSARVQPTAHTYKLLLDAFGSIGEPDLQSMRDVFQALCIDRTAVVTGAHWASLINAYGSVAKDLPQAIATFESIERHPSTIKSGSRLPDAVVYEALMNALLANDRPDLCEKYVNEMDERGVRKTAYVFNTLIKGYASQNNIQAARTVFESLADPPSGVAAAGNHPVDRHPKHQHHVPDQLPQTAPVYREPSTWETMIKAELQSGDGQRAVELMKRVEERAFPEAVVRRIRSLLTDVGLESIA